MQRAVIKKISQLKSDIRSCRFKNFSPKQASGLMGGGGGGSEPLGPSPWIRHCMVHVCQVRCTRAVFASYHHSLYGPKYYYWKLLLVKIFFVLRLTAFVMRVFCKIQEFPGTDYVDEKLLCDSVNWLIQNQRPDGALPEVYAVIHREMVVIYAHMTNLQEPIICGAYKSYRKRWTRVFHSIRLICGKTLKEP